MITDGFYLGPSKSTNVHGLLTLEQTVPRSAFGSLITMATDQVHILLSSASPHAE